MGGWLVAEKIDYHLFFLFSLSVDSNLSQTSQSSTKSSLKTDQKDVRVFVGRIPQQMTQVQYRVFVTVKACATLTLSMP